MTATRSEIEIDNALGPFSSQVTLIDTESKEADDAGSVKKEKKDKKRKQMDEDTTLVVDDQGEKARLKKEKKERKKAKTAGEIGDDGEPKSPTDDAGVVKKEKKDKKRKREANAETGTHVAPTDEADTGAAVTSKKEGRGKVKKTKMEKALVQELRERDEAEAAAAAVAAAIASAEPLDAEESKEGVTVLEGAYGDASLSETAKKGGSFISWVVFDGSSGILRGICSFA